MPWYITNGVLRQANTIPSCHSIRANITGEGKIIIPECVTAIGDKAFCGCSLLTEISLPDSITSIGDEAFSWCGSLTNISLPDSITSIGDKAFCGCNRLTRISLPNSITSIGDKAFYMCNRLTSISFPDSITSIGDRAFYGCTDLTSLSLPSISLKDVPDYLLLKLCIGFALHEDKYSDELKIEYFILINENAEVLMEEAFDHPELLYLMCREKLIPSENVDAFVAEAISREVVELTALLLSYKHSLDMQESDTSPESAETLWECQDDLSLD